MMQFKLVAGISLLFATTALSENNNAERLQGIWGGEYSALNEPFQPYDFSNEPRLTPIEWLLFWNAVAVNTSGLDHTPVAQDENRVFGHQLGPGRASRAMAIVHIAMFEVINAMENKYESYVGMLPMLPPNPVSLRAGLAQAAHDTLVALFPSHHPRLDEILAIELAALPAGMQKKRGIDLGQRAAKAILTKRTNDGSNRAEPRVNIDFITSVKAGKWRQDPISLSPVAMGAYWGEVKPFVIESAKKFRAPPPPPMESDAYARAFNEVKRLGGDGIHTPTDRTQDQTDIGIYWAYDGTPSLCAPPRLYNQLAIHVAKQMKTDYMELARLLVLLNVAMADSGIAGWESKYFYSVWRPVTGMREADSGTGFTGLGDGNPYTKGDAVFYPLGAPASNLQGPNFSPPFPAYPSGHATFGGALFQTLRKFYGRDDVAFSFVSDEFNGSTRDNQGGIRPLKPRSFKSFSEAEEENGQSRIYLGIHWEFDKTQGIAQGRKIADYVMQHIYQKK